MARERSSRRGSSRDDSSASGSGRKRRSYARRSAEAISKRANQTSSNFDKPYKDGFEEFKAEKGSHQVRVLPPTWDDAEHCGIDVHLHYNIGTNGSTYLCPREMNGDPCPICEERDDVIKKGGDDDYVYKLKPGKRVIHWVIDRDDEKAGPKYWPMPWTMDRDIALASVNKRTGEVLPYDDPDEGYDILFERAGSGLKTKYIGLSIDRQSSDLGKKADDWLDYIEENPLPSIFNFYDYDHLKIAIEGGVKEYGDKKDDKDDKDDSDSDDGKPSRRSSRRSSSKKPKHTWESIHDLGLDGLDDLVEEEGLDIDPDDFDDDQEYADEVCALLKIEEAEDGEEEEEEEESRSAGMRRRMKRGR